MNFSKQNLIVECKLRCDIAIQRCQSSKNELLSGISPQAANQCQPAIQNVIRKQMRTLFGISCGSLDFVTSGIVAKKMNNAQEDFFSLSSSSSSPETSLTISTLSPKYCLKAACAGQRRQREEDENVDEQNVSKKNNDNNNNSKETKKSTTEVQLVGFWMTAILERQHVQQLRAACASCVSIKNAPTRQQKNNTSSENNDDVGEAMIRVTVVGAPKRFLLQK